MTKKTIKTTFFDKASKGLPSTKRTKKVNIKPTGSTNKINE